MDVKANNDAILCELLPSLLWKIFGAIAEIPHGSGNEKALRTHLALLAQEAGLSTELDDAGNLLIRVPATPGCEAAPTVVLQAHLDMVCTANAPTDGRPAHDFTRDPLRLVRDGEWLKADGTTLGADNGIGVAAIMAIALTGDQVEHGPLELLLTADEEEGMSGAAGLSKDWLKGRLLFNLDAEEPGVIYIGCAGSSRMTTSMPVEWRSVPGSHVACCLSLSGLRGGHSGVEIHENRGNAVKMLALAMNELLEWFPTIRMAGINVGDKANAIPRLGMVKMVMPREQLVHAAEIVERVQAKLRMQFPAETSLAISFTECEPQGSCFSKNSTWDLVNLLLALPSGVLAMSQSIPGLVETSTNLAAVGISEDGRAIITNMPRSSNEASLRDLVKSLKATARLAHASTEATTPDATWQPNPLAFATALASRVHQGLFGRPGKPESIHAGIECGIIGRKYPDMDMCSIGPHIVTPHCPDEAVNIPSVEHFWNWLVAILKEVSEMK